MISKPEASDRDANDPTPDQIRKRAAEVRRRWSRRVHKSRRVTAESTWAPPLILTIELLRELNPKDK
jgi:hypothetical protein